MIMFGRKCTLCGGRLNGDGICTECGLNNKKYVDRQKNIWQQGEKRNSSADGGKKVKYRIGCFPIIVWVLLLILFLGASSGYLVNFFEDGFQHMFPYGILH